MALKLSNFNKLGLEPDLTGTSATTVCIGNDSRLSDSRTPTAHGLIYYSATASTVSNTGTETNFTPTYTFTANTLAVGQIYRLRAWGVYGTDGVMSTTLRFRTYAGSTVLGDSTAKNNGLGLTNRGWQLEQYIVVTAIGAGGTVECAGTCGMSTSATAQGVCDMENTAAISIDTTADQAIAISVQHQNADTDNTATVRIFMLERVF